MLPQREKRGNMRSHPHVKHPRDLAHPPSGLVGRLNDWVTDHLAVALGSVVGLYLALIIPLMALPIPAFSKIVIIISSNWIQLWGLFCLQRSANRTDVKRMLKADADHEALTHIANVVDQIDARLR
jgi:hypothetical protein